MKLDQIDNNILCNKIVLNVTYGVNVYIIALYLLYTLLSMKN
jgi:hypothetical protein